ncbi:MAG: phage tail sheath subtilisin-like domain-containing protein, partial [Janthinobacterium lividum]
AGTLSTYVGGQLVASLVNVGDTATTMAAAVVAAAALNTELPMTVTASGGVLTWTSKHKGLSGNSVDLRMNFYGLPNGEILPAGVTVAISDANNGTADPDLSGLDAILGDVAYDFVGCGFTGSAAVASIKALMATRWSSVRQVFGHAWMSVVQSEASLVTFGGTNNDPHTDIFGYYDSPTPPWEATAQILAAAAPALKADPARPVQTLQLQGFMAPPPASRFNASQKQTLLTNGIALLSHDNAGNTAILRAITTYQDNAFGQPDQSYLDCETLYTLMAITRQLSAMVTQKFPRSKVADDGTPFGAGQPIVTPKILKAELVAEYATMETNGLVEDADAMAAATIVVRNLLNPGRLDVLFCPYLIQGLRVVAIKNQFRLFSALAAAAAA